MSTAKMREAVASPRAVHVQRKDPMSSRLQNGDLFPHLNIDVVGGRALTIPRDLADSYAVVLFYRGSDGS